MIVYKMNIYIFCTCIVGKKFSLNWENISLPDWDAGQLQTRSQLGEEIFGSFELNIFVGEN